MSDVVTWPYGATWEYRAVITQTAVGPKFVKVQFNFGSGKGAEHILMYGTLGPDDYAAGRQADIFIADGETANNIIAKLNSASLDNQTLGFPSLPVAGADGIARPNMFVISRPDVVVVNVAALAQNETVTVNVRFRLRHRIPSVTITTDGTVSTAETFNLVI